MPKNKIIIVLLFLGIICSWAASETFIWDPNQEPTVAGYKMYYGDAPGHYTNSFSVGKATSTVVSNLIPGVTYYFAVTAYDASGLESGPSNEVRYKVPKSPPTAIKGFKILL